MERLLISGGTLTEHTATKAGTGIFIPENDMGAWVYGDARTNAAGSFSAKVQLFTKETDIVIAGACAYASSYPPVGRYDDTKIIFTGTPGYEITLTPEGGGVDEIVSSGSTFLLPCSYTVSSFTDRTGAPGIIQCLEPTNLTLTASSTTICEGQSTTLTASASNAAQYSLNGNDWQAEAEFNMTPTFTTAYTLYAKTEEGCVASLANAALVTVNPLPDNLTLTASPETICNGASSTLTASATNGYEYSIDNSTWQAEAEFNETPLLTTAYTLYVKTTTGCSASVTDAATVTIAQPGNHGEPSTCGCVEGTVDCNGTCKTDADYTEESSVCTPNCHMAYVQLFDACGNKKNAQYGTYVNTGICAEPSCVTSYNASCKSDLRQFATSVNLNACITKCHSEAQGYAYYGTIQVLTAPTIAGAIDAINNVKCVK
jgi:hypothetical protein